jgi:hypothetical protein
MRDIIIHTRIISVHQAILSFQRREWLCRMCVLAQLMLHGSAWRQMSSRYDCYVQCKFSDYYKCMTGLTAI